MLQKLAHVAMFVTVGCLPRSSIAQSAYVLVDIGIPPTQTTVTGVRIAPDGRALVYSTLSGGGTHSYLWQSGQFQDLGTFSASLRRNEASDINAAGEIAGSSWGSGYPALAWRWTNGTYSPLPTFGGLYSNAYSISDNGLMTGWAFAPGPANFFAFLYDGSTIVNLGELPGDVFSTGFAINSAGAAACVGSARVNRSWSRATIADMREGMQEIGTLGGAASYVRDINELGHIVGYSDIASNSTPDAALNPSHGFLWREGVMTDLGALPGMPVSSAESLNDADVVVGYSSPATTGSAPDKACRWIGTQVVDLNTLVPTFGGYQLNRAKSINNSGQILVSATLNGQGRVVILTPVH